MPLHGLRPSRDGGRIEECKGVGTAARLIEDAVRRLSYSFFEGELRENCMRGSGRRPTPQPLQARAPPRRRCLGSGASENRTRNDPGDSRALYHLSYGSSSRPADDDVTADALTVGVACLPARAPCPAADDGPRSCRIAVLLSFPDHHLSKSKIAPPGARRRWGGCYRSGEDGGSYSREYGLHARPLCQCSFRAAGTSA